MLAELIRRAVLTVWDEITMSHKLAIKAVGWLLKDVMKSKNPVLEHTPFGSKVVVFGGDYQQCLPIVLRGRRPATVAASFKCWSLWQELTLLHLTVNMRTYLLQA